jgi:membrane protein YqaA with SNARE-associated domain
MNFWVQVMIAALVAMLLVMVEHWLPWNLLLLKQRPGRIVSYLMGVLAFLIPLTILFLTTKTIEGWMVAVALWVVIGATGLGTVLGYWIDSWLDHKTRAREAEQRETRLTDELVERLR